ncbi:uncharacterized protein J3R85_017781 [Psidium guajava]|nr:uncharacterized protein J3R85_017781 [Psidium guajava]
MRKLDSLVRGQSSIAGGAGGLCRARARAPRSRRRWRPQGRGLGKPSPTQVRADDPRLARARACPARFPSFLCVSIFPREFWCFLITLHVDGGRSSACSSRGCCVGEDL